MFRWVLHLTGELQVYHVAAAVRHKVFSFGGFSIDHSDPIHVRVFDTVSLRWAPSPPPLPPVVTGSGAEGGGEQQQQRPSSDDVPSMRYGHTVVPIDEVIYMWGGSFRTGAYCNATYAFHVDPDAPPHGRWSRPGISGTVPEGRDDHSACVAGKVMFVYGGWTQLTGYTNDLYRLDTMAMAWSSVSARGTPPRACHSATIVGTEMFVFGSRGDQEANSMGVFDTRSDSWLSGALSSAARPLPGGMGRNSAIFSHNGQLYVHGGFRVLWKFNRESHSWTTVEPRGAGLSSRVPGMCCCVVGGRVIFSGGLYTRDLYVLDLSPSLKTLCKLAVIERGLERLELPRDVRWELAAMTTTTTTES